MRMQCVRCASDAVTERPERTTQGYKRFCCRSRSCDEQFNERTGSVLNWTQYPSGVIALVALWRLRYKLSLRDLPEMFAVRGMVFSYERLLSNFVARKPVREASISQTPVTTSAG